MDAYVCVSIQERRVARVAHNATDALGIKGTRYEYLGDTHQSVMSWGRALVVPGNVSGHLNGRTGVFTLGPPSVIKTRSEHPLHTFCRNITNVVVSL